MKKAPIFPNEQGRLEDLKAYNILDTKSEPCFDDITILAATICQKPVALITFIDEKRQWFKSRVGLNVPETPRDISFCGHAIQQPTLFEVRNSLDHNDFKDNPLVLNEPRVIYYAGQPLISPKGNPMGTLCVIDHKANKLNQFQRQSLNILSRQVVHLLELHKRNNEIKRINHKLIIQAEKIKKLHLKNLESAKNESLAQMAKGLCHEINNPLAIISMINDRMKELFNDSPINKDQLLEYSERVNKTVERIGRITYGMHSFIKGDEKNGFQKVSLREVVESTLSLCQEKLKDNNIELLLEGNLNQLIECQKSALGQVFYNLLMNSCDAVKGCHEKWIKIRVQKQDHSIKIAIVDSGKKIDKRYRQNLFDPFFSTKKIGKGTGLGLGSSRGIINTHGGQLTYEDSAPETTFSFTLPINRTL